MVRAASLVFLIGCGSVHAAQDAGGPAPDPDAPTADASPTDAQPSGPVAWYTMDSPAQPTVADTSGHHHDGLCGGNSGATCPVVAAGRISGAYVFNGTTDFFRVLSADELNTSTGFTVTVWLNRGQAKGGCVVNKGFGTTENNSWQACMDVDGTLAFYSEGSGDGHAQTTVDPKLPIGEWHHVALWWDGTTKATYIDGHRTAEDAIHIAFDGDDITIGGDIDNGRLESPFTGMLDDVRIYNRALSDAEITALQSP